MNIKKNCSIFLVLIISVATSGCFSKPGDAETIETATPKVLLTGRLLWLSRGESETLTILEYRMDTLSMDTLVEGIPYAEANTHGKRIRGVFSTDGRTFMTYSEDPRNIMVVDTVNGVVKPIPLSDITSLSYVGIWGAFSPDNRYLAYALTGYEGNTKSGLYLFNLANGETSTLYEAPCSSYMMAGEVCGAVLAPNWIDKTTLIFNGYQGEMPDTIEVSRSNLDPVGTPLIPSPNRTFVITIDGTILQEFEPVFEDLEVQGTALLVRNYSDDYETCMDNCWETDADGSKNCTDTCLVEGQWFDTDDIKQGDVKSKPFTLNNSVLSPDGNFILNYVNDLWHLVDIRSNSDQIMENLGKACGDGPLTWSPDGEYIACMGLETKNLQVISLHGELGLSLPLDMTGDFFVWVP